MKSWTHHLHQSDRDVSGQRNFTTRKAINGARLRLLTHTRLSGEGRNPENANHRLRSMCQTFSGFRPSPERRGEFMAKAGWSLPERRGGSSWQRRDGTCRKDGGSSWQRRDGACRKDGGSSWQRRDGACRKDGGSSWQRRDGACRKDGGSSWQRRDGACRKDGMIYGVSMFMSMTGYVASPQRGLETPGNRVMVTWATPH